MSIKVILDARKLGDGGIGTYIKNLVDGFVELNQIENVISPTLLISPEYVDPSKSSKQSCLQSMLKWRESGVSFINDSSTKYSFNEYFKLAQKNKSLLKKNELYHAPHFTVPFFLGMPTVVTIHDIIHINQPSRYYHKPMAKHLIRSAIKRSDNIITVSDASKNEIARAFKVGREKIAVIPNAVSKIFSNKASDEDDVFRHKLGIAGDYCLFVGSERPHKGFSTLVSLWSDHWEDLPPLVVVGKNFSPETRRSLLQKDVFFLGEVFPKELASLYRNTRMLLMPSREEGFGLPALEALVSGTPVLCSPIPSLTEVCANAAWYTNGLSSDDFYHGIKRVLFSNRDEKTKAGLVQANKFSCLKVARDTLDVYLATLSVEKEFLLREKVEENESRFYS